MQKDHSLSACTLSDDEWAKIGLHLKPRYLALLIRTSKQVKKSVDNEAYWTRVAFHLVWRNDECIETFQSFGDDVLTPLKENLYELLALDAGYYQGMELFIKRVDEAIIYYRSHDHEEYPRAWWDEVETMSLKEKTLEHMKETYKNRHCRSIPRAELKMTMKEVAKKYILMSFSRQRVPKAYDTAFNAFASDLEDDPMPAKYKRQFMQKVEKMLENLCSLDIKAQPTCEDFFEGICKFGDP